MKIHAAVLLLATCVGVPPAAFGWVILTCGGDKIQWDGTPRFRASAIGFPESGAESVRTAALRVVANRWNNSPADFRFNLTLNDGDVGLSNGQNEIWRSDNPEITEGAAGIAFVSDDCGDWELGDGNSEIEEADVVFSTDVPWYYGTNRSEMGTYGGEQAPFRTAAMHELGHALGLWHEDRTYNVMGLAWTHLHAYGDTATAYPGEDASNGAVELYGSSGVRREDLSVVHWRYCDECEPNGEYSVHARTRIFDAAGVELADYSVASGQRIRVEFTYENNGSTTQSNVAVRFYLSSDRALSLGDRFLGEAALNLARDWVYTQNHVVDLPDDLASGAMYYIIASVDPWNAIEEVHEENNRTYSERLTVN